MKPQAVVFDIGNVLIEWQPERFFDGIIGPEKRRAMFAALGLHAMNDRIDRGEPFRDVIVETAQKMPDWKNEIMLWHDRWLDIASPAIDHCVRLMGALKARGVPVFSLTNFGIQTYEMARPRYPFLSAFDRNHISVHIGTIQPDPAIYEALESDRGVPPQVLLFADGLPPSINAAAARGWQTHHFSGAKGWAERLVACGLLNEREAQ